MFVITVKRVRSWGEPLPEWMHRNVYAGTENDSGLNYPEWKMGYGDAEKFNSVAETKAWYEKNKEYLFRGMRDYDLSTLRIQEVIFSDVENLEI